MQNKFKMELTWHSCETCPPEEDYNPCLYVTDGYSIWFMRWKRDPNWQRFEDDGWYIEPNINANMFYWADIIQTIRKESRFSDVRKINRL